MAQVHHIVLGGGCYRPATTDLEGDRPWGSGSEPPIFSA